MTEESFKARNVAREIQRKLVIELNEKFAPVAKISSLRLLIAHSHTKGMVVTR